MSVQSQFQVRHLNHALGELESAIDRVKTALGRRGRPDEGVQACEAAIRCAIRAKNTASDCRDLVINKVKTEEQAAAVRECAARTAKFALEAAQGFARGSSEHPTPYVAAADAALQLCRVADDVRRFPWPHSSTKWDLNALIAEACRCDRAFIILAVSSALERAARIVDGCREEQYRARAAADLDEMQKAFAAIPCVSESELEANTRRAFEIGVKLQRLVGEDPAHPEDTEEADWYADRELQRQFLELQNAWYSRGYPWAL